MSRRILPLSVLLLSALGTHLTAQRFEGLPAGSWANDVTPDGRIVVGTWNNFDGFIWDWRNDPAPTVVLGGDMVAVSDDGTVVAGNVFDSTLNGTVAAIWTAANGWEQIGWLAPCDIIYSVAYDISGDGTTVVGLSWNNCSGRGFRWTQAMGMQELQSLVNGNNRCSAISGDGSALGGFAQGSFNRTPAFWDATTAGEVIDPDDVGEVYGFNEDGSMSVGEYLFSGSFNTAFVRDQQTGAITNLGRLNGSGWTGQARDISEDGTVIVGNDYNGTAREAWVWEAGQGIKSMNDRLTALGITGAPPLYVCRAVSDDGNVVVGGGMGGGLFGIAGFVASFSDPASISFRNAVPNPASYSASAPVVGANWMATVDLSQTGHSNAVVFGFDTPLEVTLGGGQVLLTAGAYSFDLPSMTGPQAVWNTPVANNPALIGQKISTQAIHFGGVIPYALSNAQDLVLGF